MGRLKPKQFQLDTIEHVFEKLRRAKSRYLVADEVGLGKTIIARGVIESFQKSLKSSKASLSLKGDHQLVLYICSSSDIGKQNIKKLMSQGGDALGYGRASRLTMLFLDEARSALQSKKRSRMDDDLPEENGLPLKLICLTPATSFEFSSPTGCKEERQFLHALLHKILVLNKRAPDRSLLKKSSASFFVPPAKTDHKTWLEAVENLAENEVQWIWQNHPELLNRLSEQLKRPFLGMTSQSDLHLKLQIDGNTSLLDVLKIAIDECDGMLDRKSEFAEQLKKFRQVVIQRLREQLALVVISSLQPHLVILDEFQNFSDMLAVNADGNDAVKSIVHALFEKDARLLLLSATPYKAATADFESAEHSHYQKFKDTIEFLFRPHPRGEKILKDIDADLNAYRKSIQSLETIGDDHFVEAKSRKKNIENNLREVMVRTERFRYLADPSNGVREPEVEPWIDAALSDAEGFIKPLQGIDFQIKDVRYLAWLRKAISQDQWMILPEIWSSLPYAINLMPKTYKMISSLYSSGEGLKDRLKPALKMEDAKAFCPSFQELPIKRLDLEAPNPKLRELIRQIKSEEIFRHLWMPPTRRYYDAPGDASRATPRKRLIFSRWQAVPQAVSVLTSLYVDEMLGVSDKSHGDALSLAYDTVELAPILFHPSLWLAQAGLTIYSKKHCGRASQQELEGLVGDFLEDQLLARGIKVIDGRLDSFEAIVAVLHRMEPKSFSVLYQQTLMSKHCRKWLNARKDVGELDSGASVKKAVRTFHDLSQDQARVTAKRISRSTLKVLAQLAIAGPAVSLLRLCLQFGFLKFIELDTYNVSSPGNCDPEKIFAAVIRTVHGPIRRFFNHSHAGLVIRKLDISQKATHLERVAEFCVRNHLSAVMDEHAFLLAEDLSTYEKRPGDSAVDFIESIGGSFRIAVGRPIFREVQGKERLRAHNRSVNRHIAQAFVDEKGSRDDSGKDLLRDQIRKAFNSPFWPFILVTTSIGQEGLDFHRYCADVVHWNLPSSPVAFEQREGRIQRYLGKAIRDAWMKNRSWSDFIKKNLTPKSDPSELKNIWILVQEKLEEEEQNQGIDRRGLSPQWIYEKAGEYAQIRRWIFCHPFSRESIIYRRMRDSVLLYRLALGQARQDDLIRALGQQPVFKEADPNSRRKLIRDLWIDLSPPRIKKQH